MSLGYKGHNPKRDTNEQAQNQGFDDDVPF